MSGTALGAGRGDGRPGGDHGGEQGEAADRADLATLSDPADPADPADTAGSADPSDPSYPASTSGPADLSDPAGPADVAALVAEARRRARAVVAAELADEFARRYRDQVRALLAAPAHPAPAPQRTDRTAASPPTAAVAPTAPAVHTQPSGDPAGPADGEQAWYVYAVVRAGDAGDLAGTAGIEGRAVTLVTEGDLAAVAALVPTAGFRAAEQDPDLAEGGWLATAVRCHDRVVERAFDHATVLPFRFGAVYPSRDDVAAALRAESASLCAELSRLDGTAEWAVRAVDAAPPALHATARQEPASGTEWMLRRREAALARTATRERDERLAAEVHRALRRHARDAVARDRRRGSGPERTLLDVAYLVERDREAAFHADVEAMSAGDTGLRFRVSGPLPPYHFVRLPRVRP